MDQHSHTVEFDGGATLGLDLWREHAAGDDPEVEQASIVVDFYAASGKLRWGVGDAALDVVAPVAWQLPDGQPVATVEAEAPPDWFNSEKLSQLERRASFTLEQALVLERSASLTLSELVDRQGLGRRSEVWSLSARCSVYVGQFEPFVTALNDPDQRAQWLKHIEALRESLVLGPEVAGRIREAFERQLGDESNTLYRMLWAYGPENLKQGAAKELVDYLDHDQLDYRVLALWNLKELTGLGTPHWLQDPRADRSRLVRRWKERLAKGEVIARKSVIKTSTN